MSIVFLFQYIIQRNEFRSVTAHSPLRVTLFGNGDGNYNPMKSFKIGTGIGTPVNFPVSPHIADWTVTASSKDTLFS